MSLRYEFNLLCHQVIGHNARVFAGETAVVCEGRRLTWRQLEAETNRFANALRGLGLRRGDRVALLMATSLESFLAFWGTVKSGCVAVPLNVLLDTDSLGRLLADSGARAVIADSSTSPQVDLVRDRLTSARHFLTAGGPTTGAWCAADALVGVAAPDPPPVRIRPTDAITVLYTSGTTGVPKGIVHTHLSRLMYPLGFGMGLRVDRDSVAVLATPPYASGTWMTMMPTMYRGGRLVILPRYTPEAFLASVAAEGGTHAFLVPTQYVALLAFPELAGAEVGSVRCLVTAGQPMAEKTYRGLAAAFPDAGIYEVYGFSEGFACLRIPADAARGKLRSVGKPLLLDDVRVVGEDGRELPAGETGEIVAHSIGMMTGYLDNPAQTERATWRDPSGRAYLRSGDLGYLDSDGYLYLVSRAKDMIKSGGINVYAVDLERVFMAHPDVSEVAAVGLPDPRWGETPVLAVIPRDGASVTEEALRAWGNERLARYQRASRVVFRAEFPRAVYGKVQKDELRRELGG